MRRVLFSVLVAMGLVASSLLPGQLLNFTNGSTPIAAAQPAQTEPNSNTGVCDGPVPIGFARCHSRMRTDTKVRGRTPSREAAVPDALGNGGAYDPAFLQSAYNLAAAASTSGGGRTVAIVDAFDAPNAEADLAVYRSNWGLPPCTTANGCFRKLNQSGNPGPYPAVNAGWAEEISLDLDMISAICPRCNITLIEATSNSLFDLGTSVNTAARLGAYAISNSYGSSEYGSETVD